MSLVDLKTIAQSIPNGCKLAVAKDDSGAAMAITAALIDREVRDLHIVCVPTAGLQVEWLLQAGAIKTLETSAITLREYGGAPRFIEAMRNGEVEMIDATCPAVYAGMQASEKGMPFVPLRGILDSDLLKHRADWKVIDNPFQTDDPIVAIKAIDPDVAVIHALAADRFGNVYLGRDRNGMLLGHAAKACFATVETIVEGNLLDDPERAGCVLPAVYVDAVAHCPQGCWPNGFEDLYGDDEAWFRSYIDVARDPQAYAQWWADIRAAAPWAEAVPFPQTANA